MMKKIYLLVGLLFLLNSLFAQDRAISGKVTDVNGSPLVGVSVTVKGKRQGTQTKEDGSFTISVPGNSRILTFSYVGYDDQDVTISGSTVSVSMLLTGEKKLDEVVVVGYGTQRRANVTSSMGTVKAVDIENKPYTSVDQMLQGKVAGLQAPVINGQPGALQSIRIRGIGSISAGADPLFVVDGLIVNSGDLTSNTTTSNSLSGINANDIETVTVLKDAQATSIYGSRGANGVIVITTKKGKAGATKFRLDAEVGVNKRADLPDGARFLNADEYIMLLSEGVVNAGGTPQDVEDIAGFFGKGNGNNTDWLNVISRTGKQQQYNLSASGGDAKNQFYLSGGYFDQEASVIASDFKRYTFRVNYKHVASDKLNFTFQGNGSYSLQHTPNNGGLFANPVGSLPFLRPTQSPYNSDGTLNISTDAQNFSGNYNPLYIAAHDRNELKRTLLQGSIGAEYSILNNLKFSSKFGVDYNLLEEFNYLNQFHGDGVSFGGLAISIYSRFFNWIFSNQLDYNTSFGKDGIIKLDAKLGYETQKSKSFFINEGAQGFPPTNDLYLGTNAATPYAAGSTSASDYSFEGLFSAVSLNYDGKYVVSGSFRRDGSSRFGANTRHGNFWSAGAAWNMDREEFISNLSFLTALKLRGSYGKTGNASIADYGWRQIYSFGYNYGGQPGGVFDGPGNANLTWESTNQLDVGLDAAFLKNRISITVDYYNRVSDRLLFNQPVSRTTGFTSFTNNIGKVSNKGIEFTLNVTPIRTKDFTWDLSFNISHNTNKVLKLPGGNDVLSGVFILREGYDYRTYYVREWAGVDPANGDPLWWIDSSHTNTTNNYNLAKRQLIGSASPKYFGGLSNTFSYKGLELQAEFVYNYGNRITDGWINYAIDGSSPDLNKYAINLARWQKAGDVTNVPRYEYGSTNNSEAFSTRFTNKGDFIKLRNLTLGYTVSTNVVKRLGIGSLRFYVRGTNLFTKTYDPWLTTDPEQGINSGSNLNISYTKSFTAGINLGL